MSKKTYYQFQKDLGLPVYLSVDLTSFDATIQDFLLKMKFSKLSEQDEAALQKEIGKKKDLRILNISEASPYVSKQIQASSETDRYGQESVIPKDGYRVYRYKSVGVMIFSFGAPEWQLGCYRDFGSRANYIASSMIINRFLTLALSPFGVLGIWGVSVEEGMVAQRPLDSKGEAVFVDLFHQRLISLDGIKKLSPRFKVMRLDPTIKGRNIKMTNEEFLSFISSYCAYMDYSGLSVPVRQMLHSFVKMTEGLIHPEESFRPRTDLSL